MCGNGVRLGGVAGSPSWLGRASVQVAARTRRQASPFGKACRLVEPHRTDMTGQKNDLFGTRLAGGREEVV
jgi:hypothetical protein